MTLSIVGDDKYGSHPLLCLVYCFVYVTLHQFTNCASLNVHDNYCPLTCKVTIPCIVLLFTSICCTKTLRQ